MDRLLQDFMESLSWPVLVGVVAATILVLGKGADLLVAQAVVLSERSGIPKNGHWTDDCERRHHHARGRRLGLRRVRRKIRTRIG